jgi:hypothetical protein
MVMVLLPAEKSPHCILLTFYSLLWLLNLSLLKATEDAPTGAKGQIDRKSFIMLIYANISPMYPNNVPDPLELGQLVLVVGKKGDAHTAILLLR